MPAGSPGAEGADCCADKQAGTLDEAAVKCGLSYATECGDGNRGDHTSLLLVAFHCSCQGETRAANAEV